jgi:hypothetical protein
MAYLPYAHDFYQPWAYGTPGYVNYTPYLGYSAGYGMLPHWGGHGMYRSLYGTGYYVSDENCAAFVFVTDVESFTGSPQFFASFIQLYELGSV